MLRSIRRWWQAVTREDYIYVVTYIGVKDEHYTTCFYDLEDALEYAERLEKYMDKVVYITSAEIL